MCKVLLRGCSRVNTQQQAGDAAVGGLTGEVMSSAGRAACAAWGVVANLRFRLINEVIRAQGGRHEASCGPRAAGHNTDRCPITMLMIAGPGSDNHIQSFLYQITIRSAHATDGFPDEDLFQSICGTSPLHHHHHHQCLN